MARPRITRRCAQDLRSLPTDIARALVEKFISDRSTAPEAAVRIRSLVERSCFSLHSGRYRAATWYERDRDVIWLIAAGVHREGSREDFYSVAEARERAGQLYPTTADYVELAAEEQIDRLRSAVKQLQLLRQAVLEAPNQERKTFTSEDGLHAELWSEAIPGLATVKLRLRIARLGGPFLTEEEVALVVGGMLGPRCVEKPDPDNVGYLFRYFEEDVDLGVTPDEHS